MNQTPKQKKSNATNRNSLSDKDEYMRKLIIKFDACGITVTPQAAKQEKSNSDSLHSLLDNDKKKLQESTHSHPAHTKPTLLAKEYDSTDHNSFSDEDKDMRKLIMKLDDCGISVTRQPTRQKKLSVHSQSFANNPIFTGKIEQSKIFQRRHMAKHTALLSEKLNKNPLPASTHQIAQQEKFNFGSNIGINCRKRKYSVSFDNKLEILDGEKEKKIAAFSHPTC